MQEIGLAACGYGCKVVRCEHGNVMVLHSRTYGHRESSVQRSSTGARCDCGTAK